MPVLGDPRAAAAARALDHAALAAAAGVTAAAELASLTRTADREQAAPATGPTLPSLPFPRVALLLLTRGPLPLARLWDEWMAGADGLVPSHAVRCCNEIAGQDLGRLQGSLASCSKPAYQGSSQPHCIVCMQVTPAAGCARLKPACLYCRTLLQAAALGCGQEAVERVRDVGGAATGPRGQPLPLYHRQHLFSVYVHAPAQFKHRYERGRWVAVAAGAG